MNVKGFTVHCVKNAALSNSNWLEQRAAVCALRRLAFFPFAA
jgi:hypothetical protein